MVSRVSEGHDSTESPCIVHPHECFIQHLDPSRLMPIIGWLYRKGYTQTAYGIDIDRMFDVGPLTRDLMIYKVVSTFPHPLSEI